MKLIPAMLGVIAAGTFFVNISGANSYLTSARLPEVPLNGNPLRLSCESRMNPLGIDSRTPRLSWWVGDPQPNAMQSAYQIVVATSVQALQTKADGWDSGKVLSDQSVGIQYAGAALVSGQRYHWRVRTWDAAGNVSPWSEPHWWEMGLLDGHDWQAQWIGAKGRDTSGSAPALYLRKEFKLKAKIRSARLYASARGIFEMRVNGLRVGSDYFAPGWTDYRQRNQYLVYDLTEQVTPGANVIGAMLGDGWHNGNLLLIGGGKKNWYGDDTSLFAQLAIVYQDGSREIVASDGSWRISSAGPILDADLFNGETYDARKEFRQGRLTWDKPGYEATTWEPAKAIEAPAAWPVAKSNPPIRKHETISHLSVRRTPTGEWIYDFGQNLSGWVKLKLQGERGRSVTLRFAEMLEADGSLHRSNLRSAKSTDTYIFRGEGVEEWEPHFTSHGFRYASLDGVDAEPPLGAVEAVVVNNAMPSTGFIETSNSRVNQLQSNIWWSQRGNAFDVPTDCPQRDERLGWTGDANFFLPTGAFNYDVSAFIEKWMADLRDAQGKDGRFTVYAPAPDGVNDGAGYSDGGVICPWIIFTRYGDTKILADNYGAMKAWIEFQRGSSNGLIRPESGYGDWLAPVEPALKPTPKDYVATAYFAHTTELFSRIAGVLGKTDDEKKYRELRHEIGLAFARRYLGPDGLPSVRTDAAFALALSFGLLPEKSRGAVVRQIVENLKVRDWKVTTGFVGTPFLMRVLKAAREDDVAYRVLLQREYPGWLYMVDLGATTIWERWNSWRPETGFGDVIPDTGVGDVKMNSFNHTVWGAVGEWMYAVIGGIDADESAPGFKHIKIRPQPGGDLTWAKAALDSPYGRIATDWKIADGNYVLRVTIPPNTRATVELPDGKKAEAGAGDHTFEAAWP